MLFKRCSIKSILITTVVAIVAMTIVGCNTVKGVGEDLSAGGKSISKAADRAKN